MKIIYADNYEEMSREAANIVADQLILKPSSVLGLATGSTPLGTYKQLITLYKEGHISFKEVTTFNLDEYCGLDKENEQSYYHYMVENLFKHINIDMSRVNIPNGNTEDIKKECLEYERKIESCGGIDLQILGIGRNGHVGFNEPDVKFEALTHRVTLDEQTIRDNSRFFGSIEEVPEKAISMGVKTIMSAKKIILIVNGKEKRDAIYQTIYGEIKPEFPSSVLQLHPDVTVIVDKEAAGKLNF